MDYATNDCGYDGDYYLLMFIASGLARQFERGNPRVIAGMSGVGLAVEAIRTVVGALPMAESSGIGYRSAEFWGGWALAHYQWYTAKSFREILRFLPFSIVLEMYPTLHEADITKFYDVATRIYARECTQISLKRAREAAGLSQSQLAAEADVSLRSIQMYEQKKKDINKAQALTLTKIARVLGCEVEDLLESDGIAQPIQP